MAFKAIKEIHKHKVKLAIDSFGLSYDELSRHRELPFSEINTNRSFICNCGVDPHSADLCETIVDLRTGMGEGRCGRGETAGKLKALGDMRCDYAQGFSAGEAPIKSSLFNYWTNEPTT